MIYVKFKTDQAKAEEIKDFYHAEEIKEDNKPYEFFLTKKGNTIIHAYKNKKEVYTIVFQSEDNSAKEECLQFSTDYEITESKAIDPAKKKEVYTKSWEDIFAQIGSDEVGVGDFFGPLVVVATYIDNKDIAFLEEYKVNDSKKMNDDYIMEIGAIIKRRIKNYVVLVSPEKLSVLHANHFSTHKVMAKCHNLAQQGLIKKYGLDTNVTVYIDQFTPEDDYRKLVSHDIISNPLVFKTKGETYYPSVAASSVIARYTFLKEWSDMETKLGTSIPKGANALVDKVYGRLKNTLGNDIVDKYVKRFFSNYKIQ